MKAEEVVRPLRDVRVHPVVHVRHAAVHAAVPLVGLARDFGWCVAIVGPVGVGPVVGVGLVDCELDGARARLDGRGEVLVWRPIDAEPEERRPAASGIRARRVGEGRREPRRLVCVCRTRGHATIRSAERRAVERARRPLGGPHARDAGWRGGLARRARRGGEDLEREHRRSRCPKKIAVSCVKRSCEDSKRRCSS